MKLNHRFIFSATLFAVMFAFASCAPKGGDLPVNKKEVMDRFVAGTLDPSYAPAAFFVHFGSDSKVGEAAVQAHLRYYLQTNQDILKVQFEQSAPLANLHAAVATAHRHAVK